MPEITPELKARLAEVQAHYAAGRDREVVDLTATVVVEHPTVVGFHVVRGLSLMALERYEEAVSSFRSVLAIDARQANAVTGLGLCLRKLGHHEAAIPYLSESFHLSPLPTTGTELLRAAFAAANTDRELIDFVLKTLYKNFFDKRPQHHIAVSPVKPLAEWCSENSIPTIEVEPGGHQNLIAPDGTSVAPYFADPVRFFTIARASFICGLDVVVAPTGHVLDHTGALAEGGDYLFGGGGIPLAPDPPRNRVFHAWSDPPVFIDEDVLFLSGLHFGHWIFDQLPRLRIWRHPGGPVRKIFTLAGLPKAHRETLARFGVHQEHLIEGSAGMVYRFRSLTFAQAPDYLRVAPSTALFMYRHLAAKQSPAHGVAGGRYYLERCQTDRGRGIANREEFAAMLDEFGFKTVRRPEVSVADQDAMFSEADIIISPTGSDLITFYQLRPGTDIIELLFKNMEQVYEKIEQIAPRYCAILGMWLHPVYCEAAPRPGKIAYHSDMIVDCDSLRRTLAKIIGRRAGTSD